MCSTQWPRITAHLLAIIRFGLGHRTNLPPVLVWVQSGKYNFYNIIRMRNLVRELGIPQMWEMASKSLEGQPMKDWRSGPWGLRTEAQGLERSQSSWRLLEPPHLVTMMENWEVIDVVKKLMHLPTVTSQEWLPLHLPFQILCEFLSLTNSKSEPEREGILSDLVCSPSRECWWCFIKNRQSNIVPIKRNQINNYRCREKWFL